MLVSNFANQATWLYVKAPDQAGLNPQRYFLNVATRKNVEKVNPIFRP
jgi:hypothetical protein